MDNRKTNLAKNKLKVMLEEYDKRGCPPQWQSFIDFGDGSTFHYVFNYGTISLMYQEVSGPYVVESEKMQKTDWFKETQAAVSQELKLEGWKPKGWETDEEKPEEGQPR